jgi:hypothetical protein
VTPGPSRGLPPRITVPIVAAVALVFLGIVGYFLRIALGTSGSAIAPDVAASGTARVARQGDAQIVATPEPGEEVVPQSGTGAGADSGGQADGGTSVGGGAPVGVGGGTSANQSAGGPPAPVQRLLVDLRGRLEKNPKDLSALVGLASLYFDAGMFPRALPYYERALAIDPDNPDTRTDYATALHDTGADLASLRELDTVLAKRPHFKEALFNEGVVASAIGRRSQAIDAFQQFLKVAPDDQRASDARTALKNLGA